MSFRRLVRNTITGSLMAILMLGVLPTEVQAQFDPTNFKQRQSFIRPRSVDRTNFRKRRIREQVEEANLGDATNTSHEVYRQKLREAQRRRIEEESASRHYTERRTRILDRLEREKQRELERKTVPRTGEFRNNLIRTRRSVRRGVPTDLKRTVEQETQAPTVTDPENPCAGFTRQRLTRCIFEERRRAFKESRSEENEK